MPRAQFLIRGAIESLVLEPNVSNDLFKMSTGYPNEVNSTLARINKRYFMCTEIQVKGKDTGAGTGDTTTKCAINLRADARGQLQKEFRGIDEHGNEFVGSIIGHIDFDKGTVQYSVSFTGKTGYQYSAEHVTAKVVFSPKTGDVGRVKVELKMTGFSVLSPLQ